MRHISLNAFYSNYQSTDYLREKAHNYEVMLNRYSSKRGFPIQQKTLKTDLNAILAILDTFCAFDRNALMQTPSQTFD